MGLPVPPISGLFLLFFTSWTSWRLLRYLLVKTDVDNVPGPASRSFWKGNFAELFNVSAWAFHSHIAEKYGRVIRINALFGEKRLYVFDVKALHHILIKDQYTSEQPSAFIHANHLIFGKGLLSSIGDDHRKQRKMLNPIFSVAHLRHMLPIFYSVSRKLHPALTQVLKRGNEVDVLHWVTRAALEIIGQGGLGYSFDPLIDGVEPHPYSKSIKQLIPVSFSLFFPRTYLLPFLIKIGPPKFRRWVVDRMRWKNVCRLKNIIDIMHSTSVGIFDERRRALQAGDETVAQEVGHGKDIMSTLMRANLEASEEDRLGDEEVLGQMSTFIFAAMDTTSNAISRILYLLAAFPEVQERLREEVMKAQQDFGEDIPYDELTTLPFLDAVCRETLRLYPPVSFVTRTARGDVILPLSDPVKGVDGRWMHEIAVPNNTNVIVSILAANRDSALWGPDSTEWKPDRWISPLPESLLNARVPGVYSHLMTFLGGARACIGFKFSELEMKVVLTILLSAFRFSPSKEEIIWEMNTIASPSVKGYPKQPCLPLIVELL